MKKLSLLLILALACSSIWAAEESGSVSEEESGHWEAGVDVGKDYGSQENLVAISVAAPLGHGFKAILEYADGRHSDLGSNVTSLKIGKELFSTNQVEFGVVAGVAHASALVDYGTGIVAGAEASYPLTEQLALKIEATRFFGQGRLNYDRANVVQGGVIFKF